MEWLIVRCDGDRAVLIDGKDSGRTNQKLIVSTGSYELRVEGLSGSKTIRISGTSEQFPLEIEFP